MRALMGWLGRIAGGNGGGGPPLLPHTVGDLAAAADDGGVPRRRRRRLRRREFERITASVVRVRSALTGAVEYRCLGSEPVVTFATVLEAHARHRGMPSTLMPEGEASDLESDYGFGGADDPASFADTIAGVIRDFARRADLPSSEEDAAADYDDNGEGGGGGASLVVPSSGSDDDGDDNVGAAHVVPRSPPPPLADEERGEADAADVEGALGGGRGAPLLVETGVHASQAAQRAAALFRLAPRRARPALALMPGEDQEDGGADGDYGDGGGVLRDTDIDPAQWYAVPPALYLAYELFIQAGVGDATLIATLDQWLHVANGGLDGGAAAAFVGSLFVANGGGATLRRDAGANGRTLGGAPAAAAGAAELVDSLVRWYNERFGPMQRMHTETAAIVWRAEQLCKTVRQYHDVLHRTALAASARVDAAAEGDAPMAEGDDAAQLLDALAAISGAVPAFEQAIDARAAATRAAFEPLAAFAPVVASTAQAAAAARRAGGADTGVAIDVAGVAAAAAGVGLHDVTGSLTREMALGMLARNNQQQQQQQRPRGADFGPKDADE